jgi:hypothetical protein
VKKTIPSTSVTASASSGSPTTKARPTWSISFYDHGVDLYLSEEEFAHFVEALNGLQPLPYKAFQH